MAAAATPGGSGGGGGGGGDGDGGDDPTNSFISRFTLRGAEGGPLAGLTVAVKDLFDIEGHVTGFGSPTWAATHAAPATRTAPPVAALLRAGALVVGKTHMDELAYALNGENAHYGTPRNAAAPGRIPGGSSSGSAAAVAAGQADIGLGSDTGGSVRVPASYCGLYGFRPTHGRISLSDARPLAPSFDTVGWFARDAELLRRVGRVLLPPVPPPPGQDQDQQQQQQEQAWRQPRWLVGRDAFALAQPEAVEAIYAVFSAAAGPGADRAKALLGLPTEVDIAAGVTAAAAGQGEGAAADAAGAGAAAQGEVPPPTLEAWAMDVFRVAQAREIWAVHGAWVTEAAPAFGPGIAERFQMAAGISAADAARAAAARGAIRARLLRLLGDDGVLCVPTAPGPAVPLATPAEQLDGWRRAALGLTCVAGLGGLPQVTLPLARVGDGRLPVGVSFIGPPNSDERLLELAVRLADALGVESDD